MNMWPLHALILISVLISSSVVKASDPDAENIRPPEELLLKSESPKDLKKEDATPRSQIVNWIVSAETIRLSVGVATARLKNPIGFDLPTITYETGKPEDDLFDFGRVTFGYSRERPIGWEERAKHLWTARTDSENYDGLKLSNFMLGTGVSVSPAMPRGLGFRLAAGVGAGVTRSETFFDEAYHFSIESWVGYGIQLGRFVIDASVRERKAMGRQLDGRDASPRTRIRMLNLGFLF